MSKTRICIKENNTQVNESCALCGGPVELLIPIWVFLGNYLPVCRECAKKHAEALLVALDNFFKNNLGEKLFKRWEHNIDKTRGSRARERN